MAVDGDQPTNELAEPELMSPELRRVVLDQEIEMLARRGYRVDARTDHHVVMSTRLPTRRRVQIFIDEFGDAYRD
jgi:hypothetical protein